VLLVREEGKATYRPSKELVSAKWDALLAITLGKKEEKKKEKFANHVQETTWRRGGKSAT